MRVFCALICISVLSLNLSAQDKIPVELKSVQLRVNLLTPSFVLEKSISESTTFALESGLNFGLDFDSGNFAIAPYIHGSFRNYYPRKKVKKDLGPNSGNYIGLNVGYVFDEISSQGDISIINATYFSPIWGLQRNYKSNIHLGFEIGPQLAFTDEQVFGDLYLRLTFGIVLL
jgi:hypothetical protein